MRLGRAVPCVALGVGITVGLAGCAGGVKKTPSLAPDDAVTQAVAHLDATSGVTLKLATTDSPTGDSYLTSAEGVITKAPAFQGTATGKYQGTPASGIPVISVDGVFQVDIPFAGWTKLDPKDLCAPDPALLLDPKVGVDPVLTSATGLVAGEQRLGGPDNKETVTPYAGQVPAAAIKNVLPCSGDGTYAATLSIDGDGFLRSADLTGDFFSDGKPITYTIEVEAYDTAPEITAP